MSPEHYAYCLFKCIWVCIQASAHLVEALTKPSDERKPPWSLLHTVAHPVLTLSEINDIMVARIFLSLFHSGVPGFFCAGPVCDALPVEGDLHPAAVPPVFTGLRYGGRSRPGLHGEEDSEEARGPAHPEGGQTARQTHPEEHVSLPH